MGDCHRLWKPQQPFLACLGEAHSLPTTVLPSCDFLLYRQNFCSSSYALFVLIKNHSLKKELHADYGSTNTPLVHSLKKRVQIRNHKWSTIIMGLASRTHITATLLYMACSWRHEALLLTVSYYRKSQLIYIYLYLKCVCARITITYMLMKQGYMFNITRGTN